ncbi:MAG TPA: sigma-70 family RNA polymerase sigma factor [bacterium]|jgi:RNA polymerase sigma factor for flagellar operon FliA|nr:sigma-70 family RNA polymerase sigma factor [bacterium]
MDEGASRALSLWLAHRDEGHKEDCLLAWLPLVKRVWARLKVSLPPSADALADDLLQCGSMGLMQALESWDPTRGVPFEAWARLRIRGAMLDELRRQDTLSKECRRRWKALQKGLTELEQGLQRPASEEEWATFLGISLEALREQLLENSPGSMVFLDFIDEEGKVPLRERLADASASPADAGALKAEVKQALATAIGNLPDQERTLLVLLLNQDLGHKEAAQVLGVSAGRISQIYAKAILHLQAALAVKFV